VDASAQKQKSLHILEGKVSISLLDIHVFLGLPFRDFFMTKLSPHPGNSRLTCEGGDLSCLMVISEYLLQVVEHDVFDLHGQINTFNAAEVIDSTMKVSLE